MLWSNEEIERLRASEEELQAANRRLVQSEQALQTLQIEYQNLVEQLTAERAHAERLAALADRFGAR